MLQMDEKENKENEVRPDGASPAPEPERKPEGPEGGRKQDEKPRKNVYDQYRYWGSGGQGGDGGPFKGGGKRNRLALIALILLVISFVYVFMSTPSGVEAEETSYTAFLDQVERGNVASVTIVEHSVIDYTLSSGVAVGGRGCTSPPSAGASMWSASSRPFRA